MCKVAIFKMVSLLRIGRIEVTTIFESVSELGVDKREAIEKQPIKVFVVLVSKVVIRRGEICALAFEQFHGKRAVIPNPACFIISAQQIEFDWKAIVHLCE